MRAVIPFDATTPKKRLAPVLVADERLAFALAMLKDVLAAVSQGPFEPEVHSTASLPDSIAAPVSVDDRPLDAVITDAIATETPVAVVMADLPLLSPGTLSRLRETAGDVVLAPGRGGGTNAMVVRDSAFETDYHGASIRDHRRIAAERGLTVAEIDSFRLGADVDEPADLLEVLLHAAGESAAWLESAGFRIETGAGRPEAVRRE
ncbi:MAG: 2-phospho-L-lactate guanylyltransferase [Halodesulfurarchaeum sp.]